jgi:prepilin-type N-terminal cleavage/methylation domain-containing protein
MVFKNSKNKSGFTLIEMLVVVVIIASLGAMILPAIWDTERVAKERVSTARVIMVKNALLSYQSAKSQLPYSDQVTGVTAGSWVYKLFDEGYLSALSTDHLILDAGNETGMILDEWHQPLHFRIVGMASNASMSETDFLRTSNQLGVLFVWSNGHYEVDDFSTDYTQWNYDISNWASFESRSGLNLADDLDIDDLIYMGRRRR